MIHGQITIVRTWLCRIPEMCVFVGLLVGIVVLSSYFPQTIISGKLFSIGDSSVYIDLPIFSLVALGQLAHMIWYMYDAVYYIDNRGVEMNIGILSIRQKRVRVRFEDIRSLEVDQSILERILNVGHILVASAATDAVEIYMDYITNPKEIQDLIQSERDKRVRFKPSSTTTREHALYSD